MAPLQGAQQLWSKTRDTPGGGVAWEIFPVVESFSWIRLEAERAQDGASDGRDPPSLYDSLVVSGIFVLIASS